MWQLVTLRGTSCVRNRNIASNISVLFITMILGGLVMQQAITTEFKDLANNVKKVRHSILNNEEKREEEERIVEELYRIFTHKTG